MKRPEISKEIIEKNVSNIASWLNFRLEEKGRGIFVSKHEILGVLEEEMLEIKEAIWKNYSLYEIKMELVDLIVGALFGVMSIDKLTDIKDMSDNVFSGREKLDFKNGKMKRRM